MRRKKTQNKPLIIALVIGVIIWLFGNKKGVSTKMVTPNITPTFSPMSESEVMVSEKEINDALASSPTLKPPLGTTGGVTYTPPLIPSIPVMTKPVEGYNGTGIIPNDYPIYTGLKTVQKKK